MSDTRILDAESQKRVLFDRLMLGVNTAIPALIVSFDSSTCLAKVKPAIRMKVSVPVADGSQSISFLDLPEIEGVPVCLPSSFSGGLFITVPIKPNDPCLLIFSQRDISNFVQFGGVQNPGDMTLQNTDVCVRHHDLSDAICIPGLFNVPDKISDWNQSAIELRNLQGTNKVIVESSKTTVVSSSVSMEISATGVKVIGDIDVTGKITVSSTIKATGEITSGTIPLTTHRHTGVTVGAGTTGIPTP